MLPAADNNHDMHPQGWIFLASLAASVLAVAAALGGSLLGTMLCAMLAVVAFASSRASNRKNPVPMPYFMRGLLFVPRGPLSPKRLKRILKPQPGERILEIGPGVGIHAFPVAPSLLPKGGLDVLDVQQEMLDDLKRRAAQKGITNITPRQGDAQKLPYPDRAFDAAYLIAVLGEIADGVAALRELRRVLQPDGRLLIGEVLIDLDFVSLRALKEKARDAGFMFAQKTGPSFCYLALFRPGVGAESPEAESLSGSEFMTPEKRGNQESAATCELDAIIYGQNL